MEENISDMAEDAQPSAETQGSIAENLSPEAHAAAVLNNYLDDLLGAVDLRARSQENALGLEHLNDGTYDDEHDENEDEEDEKDCGDDEEEETSSSRSILKA